MRAIMVIRFPGIPSRRNTVQKMAAAVVRVLEWPLNKSVGSVPFVPLRKSWTWGSWGTVVEDGILVS